MAQAVSYQWKPVHQSPLRPLPPPVRKGSLSQLHAFQPPTTHSDHTHLPLCTRARDCTTATQDPGVIPNTDRIFQLRRFSLVFVSRPIAINYFSVLFTLSDGACTGGGDQRGRTSLTQKISCTMDLSLSQPRRRMSSSTLIARATEDTPNFSIQLQQIQGPSKPKAQMDLHMLALRPSQPYSPVALPAHPHTAPPHCGPPRPTLRPAAHRCAHATHRPSPHEPKGTSPTTDPITDSDQDSQIQTHTCSHDLHDDEDQPQLSQQIGGEPFTHSTLATSLSLDLRTQMLPSEQPLSSPPKMLQQQVTKGKHNPTPTRRSQRLQAKRPPASATARPLPKPKSRATALPFDSQSHEAQLDANKMMAILQASGLKIDQTIQDMIHQAANQDLADTTTADHRPTTPLHDLIPPRAMPGENLLL